MAPSYIADMCVKRSFESEHYNLRSAVRDELVLPLARKSTLGRPSFLIQRSITLERTTA